VLGKRLAHRPLTGEGRHLGDLGHLTLCRHLVLRRRGLEFLKLQLELVEEARTALGALAESLAPELLDLQLQMSDQRLIVGRLGPQRGSFCSRHGQLLVECQQQPLQALRVVWQGID
jgi:hypothetical protein